MTRLERLKQAEERFHKFASEELLSFALISTVKLWYENEISNAETAEGWGKAKEATHE